MHDTSLRDIHVARCCATHVPPPAALGSVLIALSTTLSKQDVIDHILPILLQLLRDTNPEVRLNIMSKLNQLNQVLSVEMISQSLLPGNKTSST